MAKSKSSQNLEVYCFLDFTSSWHPVSRFESSQTGLIPSLNTCKKVPYGIAVGLLKCWYTIQKSSTYCLNKKDKGNKRECTYSVDRFDFHEFVLIKIVFVFKVLLSDHGPEGIFGLKFLFYDSRHFFFTCNTMFRRIWQRHEEMSTIVK